VYIPDDLTAEVFRPFNVTKGCSLAGRNAPAELILDYYLSQAVEKTERSRRKARLQRGETEDAAASTRAGERLREPDRAARRDHRRAHERNGPG